MTISISPLHRTLFLLSTGAASTAVEISGLRLLAPLFGTSLPVWGAVIATVLAGLALGYNWGGKKAQEVTGYGMVFMHAMAAAIIFLLLPFGMDVALWLRDAFLHGDTWPIGLNSLLVAGLTLLPPSIIFGTISPLAIQADAVLKHQSAGRSAGSVFTLTTIGSLLGILIPSFITIPFLGTKITIWIFAGLVLLLTLPVLWQNKRIAFFILGAGLLSSLGLLKTHDPTLVFAKDTQYQYVTVREYTTGERSLIFDAGFGIQSLLPKTLYTQSYWDYSGSLPLLAPHKKDLSVLVLGAATSATERQMTRLWEDSKTFDFTSVELDPELFAIADQYFDPPSRTTVVSDARVFLQTTPKTYDIILVDAYARELTVPFHLATQEFFQEVSQHSSRDGIVAVNINSRNPDTYFLQSVARTLKTVFPHTAMMHVPHSCNYLLFGSQKPLALLPAESIPKNVQPLVKTFTLNPLESDHGILLTDNRSPTDLLGIAALVADPEKPLCS